MRNKLLLTLITLTCVLCCVFALVACAAPQITSIKFEQDELVFERVNESNFLPAVVEPANASRDKLQWRSDDESVAVVDTLGNVTAKGIGSTYIYARDAKSGVEASYKVTVKSSVASNAVTLDKSSITLEAGAQQEITATLNLQDYGGDLQLSWSVEPQGVVELVNYGGSNPWSRTVVGVTPNKTATITAKASNGHKATCTVTVTEPKVVIDNLKFDFEDVTMCLDQTLYTPASANPAHLQDQIKYTCSPEGIVSFNKGSVTGLKAGTTTLTASLGDKTATCVITVKNYTYGLNFYFDYQENYYSVSGSLHEITSKHVVIPAEYDGVPVKKIEGLSYCSNMEAVTISDGVEIISNFAFQGKNKLSAVTLPDSIKSIGEAAFKDCPELTSINIPNNVTQIGTLAFAGCPKLEFVTENDACYLGNEQNAKYALMKISSASAETCTISPDTKLIASNAFESAKITSIVIPDGVKYLGKRAFYKCKAAETVTLGAGLEKISEEAFYGCSKLTEIVIPSNVTEIGDGAFEECYGITSIVLGSKLQKIGSNAFVSARMTSLVIPDSVTYIGSNAFYIGNVTELTLGKGLAYAADQAFGTAEENIIVRYNGTLSKWCDALLEMPRMFTDKEMRLFVDGQEVEDAVTVPAGITALPDRVFINCVGITSVALPNGLTSIGEYAFSGCKNLESISVPSSLKSIGSNAFMDCSSLESVALPDGVEEIGWSAFSDCSNLKNVNIPASLTEIPSQMFYNCSNLEPFDIPNNITKIGGSAFKYCDKFTSVTIPQGVTFVGSEAFGGSYTEGSILSVYWNAVNAQVEARPFAGQVNLNLFVIGADVKSLSVNVFGSGLSNLSTVEWNAKDCVLANLSPDSSPFGSSNKINEITFGSQVKSVPDGLLNGISGLISVTLPDGLLQLGSINNVNITSLAVPSTVTQMGNVTNCANLVEISVPQGLDISGLTFDNCPKFKGVLAGNCYVRGDKLTGVKYDAVLVIVLNTVTTIAANAFEGASGLKYVYIPQSVTSVEENAFAGCENATVLCEGRNLSISDITTSTKYLNVGKCTADGWIYSENGEQITVRGYIGVGGQVTVPAVIDGKAVTSVEARGGVNNLSSVFLGRSDITKLTFDSATLTIEADALANLANLTEIVFGADVARVNISKAAFEGCSQLNKISLAGEYANYQLVTMSQQSQEPEISDVTDASDLFAKINGAATGVACVILLKSAA